MADHPQNSPRGLFTRNKITVANSTGNGTMTPYNGGITFDGGIALSGKTAGKITANSTGAIIADALRVGSKATYITSNSTGVKLGNKYISTNTTGN